MSTSKFSEQVPLEVGETWEETYEKYCNDMQRGWLAHITKEVRNNDQLTEWTRSFTWEGHLGSGKHANYALSRKSIPLRTGSFYITPTGTALISRILATAWWGSSKTELGIGPSLHMSDHERSRLKFSEPGRHRELRENEPFTPQHTAGAQRRFATTSQHPTNERTELRPLAIKSPEQSSVGYQQTQYPSMSDGTQPQQPAAQQRYSGHFSDPAQFVGEYNSHPPSRRNNRSQIPIQHESRPPAQMSPSGNLFSPPQVGLAMSAHEMYAEDVSPPGEPRF
nr:uncharacterized protein CI109_001352 [Kwoniella shandongensis]KAA5530548.1 hypothetical protein CI109_001352 [Kwoniella shandongensis]